MSVGISVSTSYTVFEINKYPKHTYRHFEQEWSSSFQHILQCGVYRIIPLQHYEQFFILHGTQKGHKRRKRYPASCTVLYVDVSCHVAIHVLVKFYISLLIYICSICLERPG
ncbi:hypothetical protein EON63_21565 [archaeon]|nr:MAG: hypothetical protein EON63_21565 [archaeon]